MRQSPLKKLTLLLIVALVLGGVYLYTRPLPQIAPIVQTPVSVKAQAVALPWPASNQAALGAKEYGILETQNTNTPVSIASVAKIIAAMAVLQKKPLSLGQQGPIITLDNQDLDYFNYYYLNDGSVAKVETNEKISEYQALQALLLPSANNFADSLTRWAFGSQTAYAAYANKMLKDMGLTKTSVTGPSGYADDAKSTADDLVKIGLATLNNTVIAQVVAQQSATIPVAGEVKSTNWLLGNDGIVGIKTGNTDQAGGCYLFASSRQVDGHTVTLVGAILGAASLTAAISSTPDLLVAADSGFSAVVPVHKEQVVGQYKTPWDTQTEVIAKKDVSLLAWKGRDIKILNTLNSVAIPATAGGSVGQITVKNGELTVGTTAALSQALGLPGWQWRIFRH